MHRFHVRHLVPAVQATALAILVLAAATSATLALAAQPSQGDPLTELATPPAEVFSDSVAVRVVNVEVFVSTKKGRPVEGLTADDFELYEDGRRVEISNFFSAHDEITGQPVAVAATADSSELPAARNDDARPPTLVVYVDNLNLRPAGRQRLLDDLAPFLDRSMADGAYVMVVLHGPEGLRPLTEPTTDRAKVAAALAEVAKTAAQGIRMDTERLGVIRQIESLFRQYNDLPARAGQGPCQVGGDEMNRLVEDYARNMLAHNETTANGLSIMIGALAGWPGLKSLLYLSDGMPEFAGTDLFAYLAEVCPEESGLFTTNYSRFDSSSIIENVTQRANSNRVTIHALEARGLTTNSIDSVDSVGRFSNRSFNPSPGNDRIRTANLQSTLYKIANDTGGRAVFNANEFAQDLREIGSDARSYYSLGFKARQTGDGRVHRLRVELRGTNYVVRHRKVYRDKPVEDLLAERTLGALIFDLEDNELGAAITTRQQATDDGGQVMVVSVSIPQTAIAMLPVGEAWQGRLRLVLTARDADNNLLPIKQKIVPVIAHSDPSTWPQGATPDTPQAQLEIGIALEPGKHELALALRDEIAGTTSFLRRIVEVQPQPTAPPAAAAGGSTRSE
jgi:VWFA-related protein